MSYPIRKGCVLEIEKPVFTGSWRNPKFVRSVDMRVKVIRHSYGALKNQHTFTCVIETVNDPDFLVGQKFLIKGRNLYPIVKNHKRGEESLSVSSVWGEV